MESNKTTETTKRIISHVFRPNMSLYTFLVAMNDVKSNKSALFKRAAYCLIHESDKIFTIEETTENMSKADLLINQSNLETTIREKNLYEQDKADGINLILSDQFMSIELRSKIEQHEVYDIAMNNELTPTMIEKLKEYKITKDDWPMLSKSQTTTPSNTKKTLTDNGPKLWIILKLIRNMALNIYDRRSQRTLLENYASIRQYKLDFHTFVKIFQQSINVLSIIGNHKDDNTIRDEFLTKLNFNITDPVMCSIDQKIIDDPNYKLTDAIKLIEMNSHRRSIQHTSDRTTTDDNRRSFAAYSTDSNTRDNNKRAPKYGCIICGKNHYTNECPHKKEVNAYVKRIRTNDDRMDGSKEI